jgi:hypothetical protein
LRRCIFVGPSLPLADIPHDIDVFPPATMGSIFHAISEGYDAIGLVDGAFGAVPAVWHKEILWGLSEGCLMYGASSMGALRAAELNAYGMVGTGVIFRLVSNGAILDDDELAVYHAPQEFKFEPLSEAMINVRFAARRLRRSGVLTIREEHEFIALVKSLFFGERTRVNVYKALEQISPADSLAQRKEQYAKHYRDVKRSDAVRLIRAIIAEPRRRAKSTGLFFETSHWREHFIQLKSEIPLLNLRRR